MGDAEGSMADEEKSIGLNADYAQVISCSPAARYYDLHMFKGSPGGFYHKFCDLDLDTFLQDYANLYIWLIQARTGPAGIGHGRTASPPSIPQATGYDNDWPVNIALIF